MAGFDPKQAEKAAGQPDSAALSALPEMPIIAGSNAYDMTVSLEKAGMPKADRTENTDGYTFSSTSEDYSYIITTNADYAICFAEFDEFRADNDFLKFCASFPHDQADGTEMDWVTENIGTEATTTIGDVIYTLSVNASEKPYLSIKSVGYDDYLMQKLAG